MPHPHRGLVGHFWVEINSIVTESSSTLNGSSSASTFSRQPLARSSAKRLTVSQRLQPMFCRLEDTALT